MCIRNLIYRFLFCQIGRINLIDYKTYFRYPSKIKIGNDISINRGCMFLASAHSNEKIDIEIGNNVTIAPNVKLLSAGHDYHSINLPDTYGKITIGDNVWIGEGSTILQGVHIGEGAVIGAESVVTRDVEPWTIVVGNPAKAIRNRKVK